MSLTKAIETLNKRPLTADEATRLTEFQRLYSIDDDDPLIVVLALMAQSQLLLQEAPNLLQQKVLETIELHRTLLRDQAAGIAKELIQTLAGRIQESSRAWQMRWVRYLCFYLGGAISMALLIMAARHLQF